MADIVAEGRGVPGVVLVGVESAQYVGTEVGVPQHLEESMSLLYSLLHFLIHRMITARAVLRGTW